MFAAFFFLIHGKVNCHFELFALDEVKKLRVIFMGKEDVCFKRGNPGNYSFTLILSDLMALSDYIF